MKYKNAYKNGYDAAAYDEKREWAVEHYGEEGGLGWDAYWKEYGPSDSYS